MTTKRLILIAAVGTLMWTIVCTAVWITLSHAATVSKPTWTGYSFTGCTVDNPHAYPQTRDYTPGRATEMRGVIKTYPSKLSYGTIEAWADDYPEITYTCHYLDNLQPFPAAIAHWVWVNWGDDAKYKNYTIAPVSFTPYYDPSSPGAVGFTGGYGGPTPGGTAFPSCNNGNLNYAQQQTVNSHACFQESYNNQQQGWTSYNSWDGSCQIFFGLYQQNTIGENCIQHFGTTSPLICPDGNWTAATDCSGT